MNGKISVSAVIPAYNSEATLGRALDSVLAQTRPADEIIVVDDASTDGTASLARSYADRGVRLLSLPERRGAAAARNAGIGAAKGDWIAFLDADDEWLPAKLEKQVAAISSNRETPFVFCASEEFSPEGQSLGDTFRGWPVTSRQRGLEGPSGLQFRRDADSGCAPRAFAAVGWLRCDPQSG